MSYIISPKNARHVLQEHQVRGKEFLTLQTATQLGLIADCLSKRKVGPFTLEEFRKAAKIMAEAEERKEKQERG